MLFNVATVLALRVSAGLVKNCAREARGAGRTHGLQAEVNLFYRGHRYRSKYSHEIIPRGVEVQDMGETDRWYGKARRGVQNMRGKA